MLSELQLISFEIGTGCNYAKLHHGCPVNRPERYSRSGNVPLADEAIVAFARTCYKHGFAGRVAFHYYCEPMLYMERMRKIHNMAPEIPLCLWTNGSMVKEDISEWIDVFDVVYVTLHKKEQAEALQKHVISYEGKFHVKPGGLDNRINIYGLQPTTKGRPCWRPTVTEMPIDYYGQIHLCCSDWAAAEPIANLNDTPFCECLQRWEMYCNLASIGQPETCRRCQRTRTAIIPKREYKL